MWTQLQHHKSSDGWFRCNCTSSFFLCIYTFLFLKSMHTFLRLWPMYIHRYFPIINTPHQLLPKLPLWMIGYNLPHCTEKQYWVCGSALKLYIRDGRFFELGRYPEKRFTFPRPPGSYILQLQQGLHQLSFRASGIYMNNVRAYITPRKVSQGISVKLW